VAYYARVILDSISVGARRLVSVEACYPRWLHAELMTHRAFARNTVSSRAIPFFREDKDGNVVPNCFYSMVMRDPVVPEFVGREQAGMQSGANLEGDEYFQFAQKVIRMRDEAVAHCMDLYRMGVHKSIINRYMEPWLWHTALITATEWNNFFRLRIHGAAEKHFQKIARMIGVAIKESSPNLLRNGEWHTPYIQEVDLDFLKNRSGSEELSLTDTVKYVSAGRCARLSYLTHEGKRDLSKDIALCRQLIDPRTADLDPDVLHASPLEHVAMAHIDRDHRSGPFAGWHQFRKDFPNENEPGCNPERYV
jgi:thymidylate synthase ThyX